MRRLPSHLGGPFGRADIQGWRTTTWAAAAAFAFALTGCGAGGTASSIPDSEGAPASSTSPPSASTQSIAAVAPADTISWSGPAWHIIAGEDALYVQSEGQIARIDPDTHVATPWSMGCPLRSG